MFRKRKPKPAPQPHRDPTDVYKRPTVAEEDRTQTLEILLDDVEIALETDEEPGSDPHDNTSRLSVKRLRSK